MSIPEHVLEQVGDLYDRGLYLQAYARACGHAALERWRGPAARLLAGRLARQLGAFRLGRVLLWCAWREDRRHPEALFFMALNVLEQRGWLRAWELVSEELPIGAAPRERAEWYALRARLLALVRDFPSAERWLDKAYSLDPDNLWLRIEHSQVLARADRRPEALAVVEEALTIRPWYPPAMLEVAELLSESGREAEAIARLTAATAHHESGAVWVELGKLQAELGQHAQALHSFEQAERCWPLLEAEVRQWLIAHQADQHYFLGNRAEAAKLARKVGTPRYTAFAERLEHPEPNERRVVLPVGFVRQHHVTCAPATLAALCTFWSMSADHLEVAAQICYDGTPAHSERFWAEQNGWGVREFCVDWQSARALIDAGIPFTLQTVEPTSAHLQAVIGYDACRRTLVIRDPGSRCSEEYDAETFLAHYRPFGPRGMAMVPLGRAALLDALELPEAELYDQLYRLQRHLEGHDRGAAFGVYAQMAAAAPEHRLTLEARRRLASYDEDAPTLLACTEALLARFPECSTLQVARIALLPGLARRGERVAMLEAICADRHCHPVFPAMLAREWCGDARERARALAMARRALNAAPDARALKVYADLLSEQRQSDRACTYNRLAACYEDRNERYAWSYFVEARLAGRPEEALDFLRRRVAVYGDQSGDPACTLFAALDALGRTEEGFVALEAALVRRSEDGALLLAAAGHHLRYGRLSRAGALLAAAQGRSRETDWLRTAAQLAAAQGDPGTALLQWRQVTALEPLDADAHREVARLLAEIEGHAATVAYLEEIFSRFPYHYGMLRLCYGWFVDQAPERALALLEHLVEIEPGDGWAQRELAVRLAVYGHFEAAQERLAVALAVDPHAAEGHRLRGWLCERMGDRAGAWDAYVRAIALDVDNQRAIDGLLGLCTGTEERRTALELVWGQLEAQVIYGDGLFAFRAQARGTFSGEALLERMAIARAARPDLWHSWSALVDQLVEADHLAEACETAREATERFRLVPQLWLDLARVLAVAGDGEARIAALEEALGRMPDEEELVQALADAYEDAGQFEHSRDLLARAVARAPLNAQFHGYYADVLWRLGERAVALDHIERAVQLMPGYNWAWGRLGAWATEEEQPERLSDALRQLTVRRPGEVRSWLLLARHLDGDHYLDERLAALERALALDPRHPDCHDLKAVLLAEADRFAEALAACHPPVFGDAPPLNLRGRAAWVEAQRGELAAAIDAMEAVLALAPDYYWGWTRLADWYERTDDAEAYLRAASEMLRLEPQGAEALGYLADGLIRLGRRAEGRAVLEQALRTDPRYYWAASTLGNLQLEDGDLEGATDTLAQLNRYDDGPGVRTFAVRLAARHKDDTAALGSFVRLLAGEAVDGYLLHLACRALLRVGLRESLCAALDRAIADGHQPYAAACHLRLLADRKLWMRCRRLLAGLPIGSAAWRHAWCEYIRRIVAHRRHRILRVQIARDRELFRRDDTLWGMVGYALVTAPEYQQTVHWLADWQQRSNLEPWMLLNLAVALRGLGRRAEAIAVHRAALARFPRNSEHRLWLAWDALLAGDLVTVQAEARSVRTDRLNAFYRFLLRLLRSALAASGPDAGPGAVVRSLVEAVTAFPALSRSPLLRRVYRHSVRLIRTRIALGRKLEIGLLLQPRRRRPWPLRPGGRRLRAVREDATQPGR